MTKWLFVLWLYGVSSLSWADNSINNATIRNSTVNQAGRDVVINNQYGVPQKVVDRLLKEMDEKDIKLQERESLIASWIQKYKELETQLGNRTGNTAKQVQALLAEGKLNEAETLLKQSLAAKLNIVKEAAEDAFSLAGVKVLQLDYPAAKSYYQQAVQFDPDNADYLNALGFQFDNMGEYAEAEPLFLRSLAIREKALGKDHPNVATSLNNLAALYDTQGKYDKAEPLYLRSLAIWETALGKDHPNVATSLNNLAGLYRHQRKYAEAEPLMLRSLAIREKALGKDHPDVANSLSNLAELYRHQRKYAEAEPLLLRSLAIFEKALGKYHPNVATVLNNLARIYLFLGKYGEVAPLLQRGLTIREKILGKDHPDVAASLDNFAAIYQLLGKYAEAESLYQREVAILEKTLGKDHQETKNVRANLEALQAKKPYPSKP